MSGSLCCKYLTASSDVLASLVRWARSAKPKHTYSFATCARLPPGDYARRARRQHDATTGGARGPGADQCHATLAAVCQRSEDSPPRLDLRGAGAERRPGDPAPRTRVRDPAPAHAERLDGCTDAAPSTARGESISCPCGTLLNAHSQAWAGYLKCGHLRRRRYTARRRHPWWARWPQIVCSTTVQRGQAGFLPLRQSWALLSQSRRGATCCADISDL